MPRKLIPGLVLMLWAVHLTAVVTEDSASSNALSGITLLSSSVSDFTLSPTIPATGVALSGHWPFGMADCAVYGLQTAQALGPLIANCGANFLTTQDYRLQNYQLGLALHYQDLSLGATGFLHYENFAGLASYHEWSSNLALSYRGAEYGTEIKLVHLGQPDSELHLTASNCIIPGVTAASTYVYSRQQEDSYRFASSYELVDLLLLQVSWQSAPARFGAGLNLCIGSTELMYAVRSHPELRLSQSLDLAFRW